MKIVADQNMPLLDRTFARHGDVIQVDGRHLQAADLADADALLVRSVTRVGADLLNGSPVRFVGTATIGTDHLDTDWLKHQGIAWASAPGCNADAAAQYALAMMWLACERLGRDLAAQHVGIIGRGNVGVRVKALLETLGINCIACDPPLQKQGIQGLVSLEDALACPIMSLHVPLTRTGRWPTAAMLDAQAMQAMPPGALLVNTARGDVVDGAALLSALQGRNLFAALDVWPGEPDIGSSLLDCVTVGTPHVAGYSMEGRNNGTRMIYSAFRQFIGLDDPVERMDAVRPPTRDRHMRPNPSRVEREARKLAAVVSRDDRHLRTAVSTPGGFDLLRRDYPLRQEFKLDD